MQQFGIIGEAAQTDAGPKQTFTNIATVQESGQAASFHGKRKRRAAVSVENGALFEVMAQILSMYRVWYLVGNYELAIVIGSRLGATG